MDEGLDSDWLAPLGRLSWALIFGPFAALLTGLATYVVLKIVERLDVVDVPNDRSSHSTPTPRSGGLGVVAGALISMGLSAMPWSTELGLLVGAVLVACAVGLRDDVRPLAPRTKMIGLLAAAALLACQARVVVVHGLPFVGDLDLAVAAWPLTVFWLACYPNAFNFMDGLNGIACLTAVVSASVFAVAGFRAEDDVLMPVATLVAASCLGFLPFNFPKARIFLGDAGSLPLGLLLAWLAVRANATGAMSFPASVLLLGPFLFDVTYTLVRRKRQGHVIGEAHKDHLYQRLSRLCGDSHAKSSLAFAAMSVVTGFLALTYDSRSESSKLLSLVLPTVAMLAFAALVQRAEARASAAGER